MMKKTIMMKKMNKKKMMMKQKMKQKIKMKKKEDEEDDGDTEDDEIEKVKNKTNPSSKPSFVKDGLPGVPNGNLSVIYGKQE